MPADTCMEELLTELKMLRAENKELREGVAALVKWARGALGYGPRFDPDDMMASVPPKLFMDYRELIQLIAMIATHARGVPRSEASGPD